MKEFPSVRGTRVLGTSRIAQPYEHILSQMDWRPVSAIQDAVLLPEFDSSILGLLAIGKKAAETVRSPGSISQTMQQRSLPGKIEVLLYQARQFLLVIGFVSSREVLRSRLEEHGGHVLHRAYCQQPINLETGQAEISKSHWQRLNMQ